MLQSDSIKKLHDDERLTVLLPDFMDGADVGMIQRGSSPSFALEAGARLWVFRHFIGQELQGNEAVQVYIFGLTDNPHPPATKPFDDAVNAISSGRSLARILTWGKRASQRMRSG
jgi:hypothetical protein